MGESQRRPTSQEVAEVAVKYGVTSREYEAILHRWLGKTWWGGTIGTATTEEDK